MIDDEYLVSSCERANENFQSFSQDLTSATSTIERVTQIKGSSRELQLLFVQLNKLWLSYLEFRKEYLDLVKEALTDPEIKSIVESAGEENAGYISETASRLKKFN
jgi:hypothetical protein